MLNEWKPIPGYGGKYEASFFGKIRRTYRTKPPKILSQYERTKKQCGSRKLFVKLTKDGESGKEINVAQIIYITHVGVIPKGYVVVHKNGSFLDNEANNLKLMSQQELGQKYGAMSRKKSVVKISLDGEEVAFYCSAREAARKNFMSYQTIIDRCNGIVKKSIAPDGFDYAWEDSAISIKKAKERLKARKKQTDERKKICKGNAGCYL